MRRDTRGEIVRLLMDGRERTLLEVAESLGIGDGLVNSALLRAWRKDAIFRSKQVFFEKTRLFKGRRGISKNVRAYHEYILPPDPHVEEFVKDGVVYVPYSREYLDHRAVEGKSKGQLIVEFLRENADKALFSIEVYEALEDRGVKQRDVMHAVRRWEKKGFLYVRGYKSERSSTPFAKGFLITWLDKDKPGNLAFEEAFQRTEKALYNMEAMNPITQRIHRIRMILLEAAKLKDIVDAPYIKAQLQCTDHELDGAIRRVLQLYPDLREIKLFNNYRYYHHISLSGVELDAAAKMKMDYIRKVKGRDTRVGHNWEAAVEWFIDKFTPGARFWTQSHRTRMDPRRITIHLLKRVGDRRSNAEVDRVWEVTVGIFSPTTTNVLECKWGVIGKEQIDDFFEILRWSKEFGADSAGAAEGRAVKQGVIGVFAGTFFNPREMVQLKDGTKVSLPSYAARNNITLLKAVDFNKKLQEHGVKKEVTVQKVCRVARDECEVRAMVDQIWKKPDQAEQVLGEAIGRNVDVYELERQLGLKEPEFKDGNEFDEASSITSRAVLHNLGKMLP